MNDEAREVLVQAALSGRPQLRGALHDRAGNGCAIGELHVAVHDGNRLAATYCLEWGAWRCQVRLRQRFDLSQSEHQEIVDRNNGENGYEPQDFLTISRKVGVSA